MLILLIYYIIIILKCLFDNVDVTMQFLHVLYSYRVNVTVGVKEDRMMMTGLHTVADIFCVKCGSIVGWTYVKS